MVFSLRRSAEVVLRVALAGACCLGIWRSFQFAWADYLFRKDSEESVRSAIRLVPDSSEYYMRLSELDQEHARGLLTTALRLNRYNAQADIELGLQYEAEGDFERAEKLLLDAYSVDHTYLPRWSLTNFYFRRDNLPAFWRWARSAAEMPADDVQALFELCWRVSPDSAKITAAILNEKPELLRQYLQFLLAKDQLQTLASVAPRLIRTGDPESDRLLLFTVLNRLVAANEGVAASALWQSMIAQHWIIADTTVPNNANFARQPLPVSFDWSLPEYPGLHSWPGASGLETEFTEGLPEDCTVAEQVVTLTPGDYTMTYAYRTSDIPPETGLQWEIVDAKSNTVLSNSTDLSSNTLNHAALAFSVSPGTSLFRLRLVYRRTLGTPRISGTLVVVSTRIQAHPKS